MSARLLSLVLVLAGAGSPLASAQPVSLQEAVRRALLHDPSIAAAEAGLAADEAGVDAARARRGVQVGLEAQVGASRTDFIQDTVSQLPRQIGLQAEIPLYASGALKAGEEAARQQASAARRLLDGSQEATVLAATEAYAGTWLAQKLVEVAEARAETFQLRHREAAANFEQGLVTRTDVALTEARAASADAELARARAQLSGAEARLERLTGLAGLAPVAVDDRLSGALPLSEGEALTRALARNPSLAAARAGRGAADARAREVRGSFGPKVSVRARASTGEDIYFFFEDQITDVGAFVRVEVPMFTSGLRAASERQAEAGRSAAMAAERAAELQIVEAVSYLWQEVAAQRLGLTAARRAEAAAELAAEGAQKEYEAGIRTLVEALDAETERRNMQAARYGAEVAVLVAEARLLATLNDLGAALLN